MDYMLTTWQAKDNSELTSKSWDAISYSPAHSQSIAMEICGWICPFYGIRSLRRVAQDQSKESQNWDSFHGKSHQKQCQWPNSYRNYTMQIQFSCKQRNRLGRLKKPNKLWPKWSLFCLAMLFLYIAKDLQTLAQWEERHAEDIVFVPHGRASCMLFNWTTFVRLLFIWGSKRWVWQLQRNWDCDIVKGVWSAGRLGREQSTSPFCKFWIKEGACCCPRKGYRC